jgi:hypothetical protein
VEEGWRSEDNLEQREDRIGVERRQSRAGMLIRELVTCFAEFDDLSVVIG